MQEKSNLERGLKQPRELEIETKNGNYQEMRQSPISPESPMNSLEGVEDRGCLWAETVAWVRPRSISDE